MTFFIGITTYSRLVYIKKLIQSILDTSQEHHKYIIAINDDGSQDGTVEYLRGLEDTENIEFRLFFSQGKGSYFGSNTIFSISDSIEYDLGFSLDDDLYFLKSGWEDLYYNAYKESGFDHLSHYSLGWSLENKKPIIKGSLQSLTDVYNSQGAFYTFTKKTIDKIGYIDTKVFGKRGEGHRDWSLRACRVGMNNKETFWDAKDSHKYIRLHPKKGYITTPMYDESIREANETEEQKKEAIQDESRVYIPLENSKLNHLFDNVYLVNLKRRPDRLKKMQELLSKYKIDFQVVEAIDGKVDIEAQSIYIDRENKKMNEGEIGCYLTHLMIYRDIKEKGYNQPLIFEDDIIAHKDLENLINEVYLTPKDWGLLYLGSCDWNLKENEKNIKKGVSYYRGYKIDCTFAYSLKSYVIDDVINYLSYKLDKPCDTALHLVQELYPSYIMKPHLFIADVTDSDLRVCRNTIDYAKKVNWKLNEYSNSNINEK